MNRRIVSEPFHPNQSAIVHVIISPRMLPGRLDLTPKTAASFRIERTDEMLRSEALRIGINLQRGERVLRISATNTSAETVAFRATLLLEPDTRELEADLGTIAEDLQRQIHEERRRLGRS